MIIAYNIYTIYIQYIQYTMNNISGVYNIKFSLYYEPDKLHLAHSKLASRMGLKERQLALGAEKIPVSKTFVFSQIFKTKYKKI